MFRKKHSEALFPQHPRPLSPLQRRAQPSPLALHKQPPNLSPMRSRQKTPTNHCQQPNRPQTSFLRSPHRKQNTFQGKMQSLVSDFSAEYASNQGQGSQKGGYRGQCLNEETSLSNVSCFSKHQPSERGMKESKRLFTKCISEMNSQKKRVTEASGRVSTADGTNFTTFKALKIQMIESVLPEEKAASEKRMPFMELRKAESEVINPFTLVKEVQQKKHSQIQQPQKKEQKYIQLFNQSFSSVKPVPDEADNEIKVLPMCNLDEGAKLLESIYEEQMSDYTDFDQLMARIAVDGTPKIQRQLQQSVKVSMESAKSDLDMSPFL